MKCRLALTALVAIVLLISSGDLFAQSRDKVEDELEKTENVIERAQEAVRESGSAIAEQHLNNALKLQTAAWDRYRSNRLIQAANLTRNAREQAMKAIGIVQSADQNNQMVRREIERTDELIRKSEERVRVSRNEKAYSLIESAQKTQTEAREFFRSNRIKIALTVTMNARETARKAFELADAIENSQDRLERELDRTEQFIRKARETAAEMEVGDNTEVLLQRAEEIQGRARAEFGAKQFGIALERTKQARELALNALKLMEQEIQPERLRRFLEKTDKEIERLRTKLSQNPKAQGERLLDAAVQHQESARAALAANDLRRAVVEAKAARELVAKAIDLIVD